MARLERPDAPGRVPGCARKHSAKLALSRHERARRIHAGARRRRSDKEWTPGTRSHRQRTRQRDRRSDGARQCLDVCSSAGHGRPRRSSHTCRHARCSAGFCGSHSPSDPQTRGRSWNQRRPARRPRCRDGSPNLGYLGRRVPAKSRRLAAQSQRRTAAGTETGRQVRAGKRGREFENSRYRLRGVGTR